MIDSCFISHFIWIQVKRGSNVSRQTAPINLYNNTYAHWCAEPKRDLTIDSPSYGLSHKIVLSPHALTSRAAWHFTEKGWSSDFPPLPSTFSPKRAMAWFSESKAEYIRALQSVNVIERSSMAFMLRSHNGVHCCGTVGDSHSHSQLSTAKCTFTGDSFQNHAARTVQTECNRARSNCRGAASFSQFRCKGTNKWAKYQILFENFRNREALATIGTQEQKYFDEVKVTKKVLLRPTIRSFKDVQIFVPRPPVFFGNACIYRGFETGGLQIRPPLHLP